MSENNKKRIYISMLIMFQIITFITTKSSFITLIYGIVSSFSCGLCVFKDTRFFYFSYFNNTLQTIIGFKNKLYGESVKTLLFLVMTFFGKKLWHKNKKIKINTKLVLMICIIFLIFLIIINNEILLNLFMVIVSYISTIIMLYKDKNHYLLWIVTNLCSMYLWFCKEQYNMILTYVIMSLNNLYGYYKWGITDIMKGETKINNKL